MTIGTKLAAAAMAAAMLLGACSARTPEPEKKSPLKVQTGSASSATGKISGVAASKSAASSVAAASASVSAASRSAAPSVELSTNAPVVGETMSIHVKNAKAVTAATSLGFTPRFFANGEEWVALLPVAYTVSPGNYTLDVTADGKEFHYTLAVTDREFEQQYLTVDETTTKNTAGSADANNEWTRRVEPLKPISDPKQYWSGRFISPIAGEIKDKISTEYGSMRYTNGSQVATRHSGIDIAVKAGTPVLAVGNGRVQFADYLQLTGNTVVIEHGFGLKSLYYHMESLNVQEGDMVEQGQQVGAVGSTGFSTGPHCHLSMAVNNIFTNPWTLMEKGIE